MKHFIRDGEIQKIKELKVGDTILMEGSGRFAFEYEVQQIVWCSGTKYKITLTLKDTVTEMKKNQRNG